MAKTVESWSLNKVFNLVFIGKTCFPYSNLPLIARRVWWQLKETACQKNSRTSMAKTTLVSPAQQGCMSMLHEQKNTRIQQPNLYCDRIFKLMPRQSKCINCLENALKSNETSVEQLSIILHCNDFRYNIYDLEQLTYSIYFNQGTRGIKYSYWSHYFWVNTVTMKNCSDCI